MITIKRKKTEDCKKQQAGDDIKKNNNNLEATQLMMLVPDREQKGSVAPGREKQGDYKVLFSVVLLTCSTSAKGRQQKFKPVK